MSKATQKGELGKDALLTRLGGWFGYYFNINDVASGISQENGLLPEERQAYAQLVKIVEQHFAEQSGEVDEDVQELIDWLQKCIDRPAMIQVSHPHLAWYPTEKDKANWQKVKQLLTQQPVQVDEEKKIEEIRMMIQKATSEYMPVYRRIYLNDAVEVEIRKLLTRQPQRRVTREDIYNFRMNLFTISMEYLAEENEEELEQRELSYIASWLKELGIEVVESKEGGKNERK